MTTGSDGARGAAHIDVGGDRSARGIGRATGSFRRRFGAGLLALWGGLAACAGGPSAPSGWTGPFDATTVLARATAAAGGEEAQAPATQHSKSRVVLYPPSGSPIDATLEVYAEEPGRFRREFVTASGHSVIQVEADGRQLELEDGRPTGIDHSRDWPRLRRYRHLLAELAAPGPQPARIVDDPGCDPRVTVVVERELAPGERWQAWFDAKSLLVSRVRCIAKTSSGETIDEDFLSQHERIGGRIVARRQVTWQGGRRVKETLLLELEDGVTLDPELFKIEPGTAAKEDARAEK